MENNQQLSNSDDETRYTGKFLGRGFSKNSAQEYDFFLQKKKKIKIDRVGMHIKQVNTKTLDDMFKFLDELE